MINIELPKKDGHIEDLDDKLLRVKQALKYLPNGVYMLTVKKCVRNRTTPQNRLYRLWLKVLEVNSETGNSAEDFHQYFKSEFLPPAYKEIMGREIEVEKTTTTLSTVEMSAYLDRIQAFASTEFGIILPSPDDLGFEQMIELYGNN